MVGRASSRAGLSPIVVLLHCHLLRLRQARSCNRLNPILIPDFRLGGMGFPDW
jgi:hypothetical protein